MPTREEENAALMSLGYSPMPAEPSASAPAPLPPKPMQDEYALEAASTPSVGYTPVSQPRAEEPAMSLPPAPADREPPRVEAPAAPTPSPRAPERRPAPKREAPAAERPEPALGQVTDADILGLPSKGKNVGLPAKAADPSATTVAPTGDNPYEKKADGIEDLRFDKSAKTRKLQAESAQADNRTQELIGQKGDIVEGYGEQRQAIHQERGAAAAQSINEARTRASDADERYEDTREEMEAERRALKEKMGKPPFDTVGLVMGLVGALAAAHGKPEAGRMLQQGVGGAINSRMKRWQGEIEGGQGALEGMGKLVNMDRLHAADEDQAALAIHKALGAEFDASLDEARSQAKTQEELNAVDMLQNDFRKKLSDAEQSTRAKAQAAAHRRMVNGKLANAKTEEERQWIAEHYGDVGRDIDKANLKNQDSRAKIGSELLGQNKTVAETGAIGAKAEADRAKAAAGPETTWAPKGWVAPAGVTDPISAKVFEEAKSASNLSYVQGKLLKIAEDVRSGKTTWTDGNTKKEIEDLRVVGVPMGTQAAGAGAPNAGEFDRFMEVTADPQKWFQRGDSYTQLATQLRNTTGRYERLMETAGYTKQTRPGEARPAPAKRKVEFSDGTQAELRPDEIQALMARGSKLKAVN